MNGWSSGRSLFTIVRAMGSYEATSATASNPVFRWKPEIPFPMGRRTFGSEHIPPDYNHTIEPYEIKQFIGRIMQYGYTGSISTSW